MQMFALDDLIAIAATPGSAPNVDSCHQRRKDLRELAPDDEPKVRGGDRILAAVQVLLRRYGREHARSRRGSGRWSRIPSPTRPIARRCARRLLGVDDTPGNFVLARSTYAGSAAVGVEPPAPATALQEWFGARIWDLRSYGVFRPWIYGLLGAGACALAAWRGRWWPCFIALSGLTYELGLFLVAPSSDYRYSYWMIVSALIAAAWLRAESVGGRRRAA